MHISRVKIIKASMILSAKNFFADPQWIIPCIIAPFVFTLVALFLFKNASGAALLYAVLGGGMMGMWGTTVYGSGNSIAFDRWNGTMESTLAAPSPLIWIILGRVTWNTFIGIINGVVIFAFGFAWFRTGVSLVNPPLFVLAAIATFVSLSAFGLMLSSIYILTRKGGFIENSMEIPIYIATGTMFPIALLPFFVQPISFIIGPTWGIEAIRIAALKGYVGLPTGYWLDMLVLGVETFLYFALCFALFVKVESVAKRNGTLDEY